MGIFCMIFGVIVFLGFTGGGFVLANLLTDSSIASFAGRSLADFASLTAATAPYVIICAVIGFMIGLSFFMKGLIYHKLSKKKRRH